MTVHGGSSSSMPGTIGPFRTIRRLGAGGMAEAFEAVREGPGGFRQRVCVKRILPTWSTERDFVRLFVREARLAAALSHRNITRVVDFGEDRGCHYLALELVDGLDLRRFLRALPEPRRVPTDLVALIGLEIAEALEHAHTRGGETGPVIHRDVSPANILLGVDGGVKLTDFGISKALFDSPVTRSEMVRGNVWYMAPEQLEAGRPADPRSDLFSLGVVLYQCLSGRRPYHGPTDLAAMMALAEGRRMPLLQASPEVPEAMAKIVERLLASDPERRFPTAASVAESLASLAPVATARRALRQAVCDLQKIEPSRRLAVQVTLDAARTVPDADAIGRALAAAPPPSPTRSAPPVRRAPPARWNRYAVGPKAWASAGPAADMRAKRGPAPSPSIPALPIATSRILLAAAAIGALGAISLCATWLLAW